MVRAFLTESFRTESTRSSLTCREPWRFKTVSSHYFEDKLSVTYGRWIAEIDRTYPSGNILSTYLGSRSTTLLAATPHNSGLLPSAAEKCEKIFVRRMRALVIESFRTEPIRSFSTCEGPRQFIYRTPQTSPQIHQSVMRRKELVLPKCYFSMHPVMDLLVFVSIEVEFEWCAIKGEGLALFGGFTQRP